MCGIIGCTARETPVVGAILAATLISSKESRSHAEAAQRGDVAVVPAPA